MAKTLHVIGERQAGKTEMVLSYAHTLISHNLNVVVYTVDNNYSRQLLARYESDIMSENQKAYRSKREVIDLSGGTLYFSSFRNAKLHNVPINTVIIDDTLQYWDSEHIKDVVHPDVSHIVRTVM